MSASTYKITAAIVCVFALMPYLLVRTRREARVENNSDASYVDPGSDEAVDLDDDDCAQGSSNCLEHTSTLNIDEDEFSVNGSFSKEKSITSLSNETQVGEDRTSNPNFNPDEDTPRARDKSTIRLEEDEFSVSSEFLISNESFPTETLVVEDSTPNPNLKLDENITLANDKSTIMLTEDEFSTNSEVSTSQQSFPTEVPVIEDSTLNPNLKLDEDIPLADDKSTIMLEEDEFSIHEASQADAPLIEESSTFNATLNVDIPAGGNHTILTAHKEELILTTPNPKLDEDLQLVDEGKVTINLEEKELSVIIDP